MAHLGVPHEDGSEEELYLDLSRFISNAIFSPNDSFIVVSSPSMQLYTVNENFLPHRLDSAASPFAYNFA